MTNSYKDSNQPPKQHLRSIRRRLLAWYDKHRRDLPWRRRTGDAYAQWVAEIMLQQTRVETVVPYYERFLKAYPNVQSLAHADFDDVLKHWEGLGYYRRILHLHRAAQIVCERGGDVPTTSAELRELPGIGEYTSAAIASIAFGEPVAAVDGNVARVLSRLFHIREDTGRGGRKPIQALADALILRSRPGDFNQAWMDLGSAICTPRDPACERCPLQACCRAGQAGDAHALPVRGGRTKVIQVRAAVGLFRREGRLLMLRRKTGGLWSGLWEFPNVELGDRHAASAATVRLADEIGIILENVPRRAATVRHELTHRSMRFEVFLCDVAERGIAPRGYRWVNEASFRKLAVSTAHRRIFAAAMV